MDALQILKYGHPLLREKCPPVQSADVELAGQVERMKPLLYHFQGVGLAAPQVGIRKRFFICDVDWITQPDGRPGVKNLHVFVNPEIRAESPQDVSFTEGCLSIPGIEGEVYRPESVEVRYFDLAGTEHQLRLEGLLARVVQHEIDHLNGVLFIDRMSFTQRALLAGKLRKLKNECRREADADCGR